MATAVAPQNPSQHNPKPPSSLGRRGLNYACWHAANCDPLLALALALDFLRANPELRPA